MESRPTWIKASFSATFILGLLGAVMLFSPPDATAQISRSSVSIKAAVNTGSTYVGISSTRGSAWRDSRHYRHPGRSGYHRSGPPRVITPAPRPRGVVVAPYVHRRPVIATSFVYHVRPAPAPTYRVVETRVTSAAPPVGYQVSVATDLLNVRAGPAINEPIVRTIRLGEILTVEGNAPGWLFVSIAGRGSGWVMEHYTRPLATHPAG